jgi:hypothetical protein
MSQPSFQAANAVIYLTYGAFLYGAMTILSRPCPDEELQDFRPRYRLAMEAPIQIGVFGQQQDAKGSDMRGAFI